MDQETDRRKVRPSPRRRRGLINEETRTVTVGYLEELYTTIARQKILIKALTNAILGASELPTERIVDDFCAVMDRDADDLTAEEVEEMTLRQQEVVLARLAGRTFKEIAAELGISEMAARNLHSRGVTAAKRERRRV